MHYYYLGAFPPGWGGVTVKNRDLYEALIARGVKIRAIDFNGITRRHSVKAAWKLCTALSDPYSVFVVGVSAKSRRKLTELLYRCSRKAMGRSSLILMGGAAAEELKGDSAYREWLSCYRVIYAETVTMMQKMQDLGLQNVSLYPNGRHRPEKITPVMLSNQRLQCVFFSKIHPMKGVENILQAAQQLPDVDFRFYGEIQEDFRERFACAVASAPNVSYCGVFTGTNEQVYEELSRYDVLLFPTKYQTEGVPGILAEAKIAGLAVIASDESFNSELVCDGVEGIILQENTREMLARAIQTLDRNREKLLSMKKASRASAERFYMDRYLDEIVEHLVC